MSMTEEERRRARAEASRRCRERKAAMAAAAGVKNKNKAKPKAEAEAKPAARPAQKQPDPLKAAERVVKRFAKVAAGIKPMLRESADVLAAAYKTEDEKTAAKVERLLAKSLGVAVGRLPSDSLEKTRVCLDASSKTVKTPAFRLAQADGPAQGEQAPFDEDFDEEAAEDEPSESVEAVPVDPMSLVKIESGEAAPDDVDELLDDEGDEEEEENEDEDEDEDDEDDESEAAVERRRRRREREDSNNERDWASGRWEMIGEMGAQGAFDD